MVAVRVGFWTWIWPELAFEHESEPEKNWGENWLFDFNWKASACFIQLFNDGSALEENSSFHIQRFLFSKLDSGFYIESIAKNVSKKLEPWFVLWSFILQKLCFMCFSCTFSIIQPCMEYCCLSWCSNCYLDSSNRLQKLMYVELSLVSLMLFCSLWLLGRIWLILVSFVGFLWKMLVWSGWIVSSSMFLWAVCPLFFWAVFTLFYWVVCTLFLWTVYI